MATELSKKHCAECAPGTPPLEEAQAAELQGQLDRAWIRETNQVLHREFTFQDFKDAFGFATRVALLAEEEGHHPDLEIGWGRVHLALSTHSAGGLTHNDFILAAKVDQL
jgi:4a-hydroxytetrahydrobiopterin dehydratase